MFNTKHILGAALTATLLSITPVQAEEVIKLATTTSTENSGLLKELLPTFEAQSG